MHDDVILEIRNVSKSFSGVQVLSGINMRVRKGEVHVVVGENGAGKSTLMKIISGVYQKDGGELLFEGKPIEVKSIRQMQEMGISIIHQEFNLLPNRTIAQNIFLGREPVKKRGIPVIDIEEMNAKSRELLGFLGLNVDPRTRVSSLGIAQQQMIEVAKALSFKSKVLIMDEPTATLTRNEISKLFEIIRKLKNEGVSIIYISHRLEELKEIADTISVLRDGALVGTLDASEATTGRIIKMMGGREITNQYHREFCTEVGEEVLRIDNLSSYRFKNVSLKVHRGEIVGISGLVGAGRTELIKAIFGFDRFESGEVVLFGKKYRRLNTSMTTRLKVGLVPEDRKDEGVIVEMPIRENIVHASLSQLFKNGILNKKTEAETANKYVKELGIVTNSIDKHVEYLSGGNQQKVVVAKWLCAQCDLILFDEPTRGIDVGAREEIYEIMNALVKQGKAVLMISSDMPELLGLCDRIYVMKDGRITQEFSHSEATQEKLLACSI
ncbi:MAG: sugar ABC transporter ATP-binding protein [Christensenellaceae bacterium]|nr:sugar ABC transporter ATP-binding protein [Christensenellaceae bacterium]